MRIYYDNENKFSELFNPRNGFYVRSGIFKDNVETEVDPFMRNMPNLVDIGVMGHCSHGASGLCSKSGVECYQDGLHVQMPNMSIEQYKTIIDQISDSVFQVALGGRGDPNKHENFEELLQYSRYKGVVPNYTTSGLALTDKEVSLTKKYCGAVAVSYYFQDHTTDAINKFLHQGCLTNIHFVLSATSIDIAIDYLANHKFPTGINAVIFLLHKPVGLGTTEKCLSPSDPRLSTFFNIVDNWKLPFKLGFDSCSMSGVLNKTQNINKMSMDACEAARFSMYISSDLIAVPCSFDATRRWGVNLNNLTVLEAWNSPEFDSFRKLMITSCPTCADRVNCYGGCQIVNNITLCARSNRSAK